MIVSRTSIWAQLLLVACGPANTLDPSEAAALGAAPLEAVVLEETLLPRERDRRGDEHLLAGRFDQAIDDFDAFLISEPDYQAQHWRRGIAYYYAGRFADGVRQFELHRQVNPNDVENAAWHFLCKARLDGIEAATEALLPVGRDFRDPMAEVLEMFAGRLAPEAVLRAADASRQASARFYGQLYVGLYHEVQGQASLAGKHLKLAADQSSHSSYMGAVARMHAQQY